MPCNKKCWLTSPTDLRWWLYIYQVPYQNINDVLCCSRYLKRVGPCEPEWGDLVLPELNSFSASFQHVYSRRGLEGLFAGLPLHIAHDMAYKHLVDKLHLICRNRDYLAGDSSEDRPDLLNSTPHMRYSVIRCLSTIAVYPLSTIATRTAVQRESISIFDTLRLTWECDGIKGFYGGVEYILAQEVLSSAAELAIRKKYIGKKDCEEKAKMAYGVVFVGLGFLSTLALIGRAKSKMPGLCCPQTSTKQILKDIPWGWYALSVAGYSAVTYLTAG